MVITPDEGMTISKVTVNGKEVTVTDNKITGTKAGDKIEVVCTKIEPAKEELSRTFAREKTSRTYINTAGKKGRKHFYKAKIMIYDRNNKLIASSELKQCKYGARLWTK